MRLVVREGQEAIVSRYGQITAAFGPGLHTVNVRACGAMECLFDLQTGGKTTYYMDIYFINMAVRTAFKWGLSEKMHFRDLVTGAPVELGVSGNISLRVADSRRFLLGLVGYRTNYSWGEDGAASFIENPVSSLIDHVVKSNLPQIIKKERIDVLELDENTDVISEQLRGKIAEELKEYGLAVPKFYVTIFA